MCSGSGSGERGSTEAAGGRGRAARHPSGLPDGLPVHVLQVREDRDHGHEQCPGDTRRRAYLVTPQTESCPGCGQIEGVVQTTATTRVAAWKCTCGLDWATSVVNLHAQIHGQQPQFSPTSPPATHAPPSEITLRAGPFV
jgi:hypothetical protein